MSQDIVGACGCAVIQFKIHGPARAVVNCHCRTCRQRNGSAYSTYCVVAQDDLEVTQGRDLLASYALPGRGRKQFCSQCGSPLFNDNVRYPGMFMVFYGSLSGVEGLSPTLNVYCESKLPWVDGLAGMKSFEQGVEKSK